MSDHVYWWLQYLLIFALNTLFGIPVRKCVRPFLKRKTLLASKGKSDTAKLKDEIQATLRAIVIARDGGCILRSMIIRDFPQCGGYRNDGQPIFQADHLISRANSATFADSRLVVCLCKAHHGWKSVGSNARKAEYDNIVRMLLPIDRVVLWDRCEKESGPAAREPMTGSSRWQGSNRSCVR